MDFPEINFEGLNETEVREAVIAPLLKELDYASGTKNNIRCELPLAYPRKFLGRKKTTDELLKGKPDYICEVEHGIRWCIEAKAPHCDLLDVDTVDQVCSYSMHPRVAAVYFCLCNGKELLLFQSNKGAEQKPFWQSTYEELPVKLSSLKEILSPAAILRDHPSLSADYGEPLAPGFKSKARLLNGKVIIEKNSANLVPFNGLTMAIRGGSVERVDGNIEAFIETTVPYKQLQDLNEKLGLHAMSLIASDRVVSSNPQNPTKFTSERRIVLPAGTKTLNLLDWTEIVLPIDVTTSTVNTALGILSGNVFSGDFRGSIFYHEFGFGIDLEGVFEVHLE